MVDIIFEETQSKMEASISSLSKNFQKLRTGQASPDMLDGITVDYYGAATPLSQVGNISVPEARLLVIQPWEKTLLSDIERAIFASDLGITPQNDGNMIRLNVPALTEDRRKELVKDSKSIAENAKVAIRNIRRDANNDLKKLEKDKEISEDELADATAEVQKITDLFIAKIDEFQKTKEKDLMEI